MEKIKYTVLFLILFSHFSLAQRDLFADYRGSMLTVSPSFAGVGEVHRFMAKYRKNPNFSKTNLYCFSYDRSLAKINSGIGILLNRDEMTGGVFTCTNIALMYSYDFQVGRDWHIRPAISGNYVKTNFDLSKVTFADQYFDGQLQSGTSTAVLPPEEEKGYFDASASVMVYNSRMKGGFTVSHLLKPNSSIAGNDAPLPVAFSAFGDYKFMLNKPSHPAKEESISIYSYYRTHYNAHSLVSGGYFRLQFLIGGIGLRFSMFNKEEFNDYSGFDAVLFNAGFYLKGVTFTYLYEMRINSPFNFHEVSLRFEVPAGKDFLDIENW